MIGRHSQWCHIIKAVHQNFQIGRAYLEVVVGIVKVALVIPMFSKNIAFGSSHDLHQPKGTDMGFCFGVAVRFVFDHSPDQIGIKLVGCGMKLNQLFVIGYGPAAGWCRWVGGVSNGPDKKPKTKTSQSNDAQSSKARLFGR